MMKNNYKTKKFNVSKSEQQWSEILTPQEFKVLRQNGTEAAFSGKYAKNYDDGIYHCKGCEIKLFDSKTKYDSGTGWPSFWQPINENAIETEIDRSLFMKRVEVHCSNCGGHLGHLFKDGPKPTGLRYCINSISLIFKKRS